MNEKEKEYSERAKDWKNILVNQISFTNNLISTLAAGYLLYLIDKLPNGDIKLVILNKIDWRISLYMVTVILVLISIMIGTLILLSRLYDFRITRNIALTRKRICGKHNKPMPDFTVQGKGFCSLFCTIFNKIDFVEKSDCDQLSERVKTKFNKLRTQSKTLGNWTWKLTKIQLFVILVSVISHFISLIM
jgi:vacuolar-type H+-ATPase subunit I/STV1